jgi:sugar lactone lactonase YvrE
MDVSAADRITDPLVFHGEGPFWDERFQRLLWVDMLAGAVMSRDASGVVARHPTPSRVASVVRARRSGGYVLALEHGFAFADETLTRFEELPHVTDDDGIKLNEGGCDPLGRFYTGSMAYDETPGRGTVWRLDSDLTTRVVVEGVTISNGLQWSADGSRAFYIDSPTNRVDVFDVVDGELANRREHLRIESTPGNPDGMAIDAEDGLWVALWGGSAVRHYDASGVLRDEIALPVSHVTACAFGGVDRRTLFITTSRLGIADGEEPLAGSLFAFAAPVAGAVLPDFAG